MDEIFFDANLPIRLKTYEIVITSPSSGFIEFLPNTISIDGLKKLLPPEYTLNMFYQSYFKDNIENARLNFIESLAGYCLVSYLLQRKDRPHGNILIQSDGQIIHIDYGFILGTSPGNMKFEKAPYKFTTVNKSFNILGIFRVNRRCKLKRLQ
jgi:phosphatidylinositol 4-kinase